MKIKRNSLVSFVLIIMSLIIISGCILSTSIEDVKNSENIGKEVTISGTVENTIKLGDLSGYTIKDKTDTISVSSQSLPEEGIKIRVTGTLIKDTLFGYYIKVD